MERMKRITQHYMVASEHLNGSNRLFGGQLMAWMDSTAGILGRLYAGKNVTTRAVKEMVFESPAYQNDMVVLEGVVSRVGNTSITVDIKAYAQGLSGEIRFINSAQFIMVALDAEGKPAPVEGDC